jgi:hypothetical protein
MRMILLSVNQADLHEVASSDFATPQKWDESCGRSHVKQIGPSAYTVQSQRMDAKEVYPVDLTSIQVSSWNFPEIWMRAPRLTSIVGATRDLSDSTNNRKIHFVNIPSLFSFSPHTGCPTQNFDCRSSQLTDLELVTRAKGLLLLLLLEDTCAERVGGHRTDRSKHCDTVVGNRFVSSVQQENPHGNQYASRNRC